MTPSVHSCHISTQDIPSQYCCHSNTDSHPPHHSLSYCSTYSIDTITNLVYPPVRFDEVYGESSKRCFWGVAKLEVFGMVGQVMGVFFTRRSTVGNKDVVGHPKRGWYWEHTVTPTWERKQHMTSSQIVLQSDQSEGLIWPTDRKQKGVNC